MQIILKAIIPRHVEIAGYIAVGIFMLVLVNVKVVIDFLFAVSQTDADVGKYINSSLLSYVGEITDPLNGRLGNAVIWAIIGAMAFCLGAIAITEIRDLTNRIQESKNVDQRLKLSIWLEFIVRSTMRVSALVGLLLWIYYLLNIIGPYLSNLFMTSLFSDPVYFWGVVGLLAGGVLLGLYIYLAAVLCRFATLRLRVFSDMTIDEKID